MDLSPGTPVVCARGLRKRFGRVRVLRGLDLTVRSGEVFGLVGRNGAGKTTAIRSFLGMLPLDGGTLELFGTRTRRPGTALKRHMAYVSQEQHLTPWMSAKQLGRFVGGFYRQWDASGYAELLARLEVPPRRRVSALSGGTRVKVALALALASRAPLLLLDEPTAGLDAAARREFLDLVAVEVPETGRTVLFSSHVVADVERIADTVGVLVDGRLAYEGGPAALVDALRVIPLEVGRQAPGGLELVRTTHGPRRQRMAVVRGGPPWPADAAPVDLEEAFLALALASAG